jgi:Tol biopolymer transport system component
MKRNISNEEIATMLRHRAGDRDDQALGEVLRLVGTTPQEKPTWAARRPPIRALILVTLLAIAGIGGAVLLGFRPKPPPDATLLPASLSYSDGCGVMRLDASDLSGPLRPVDAMVPPLNGGCSWPIAYDLSWSGDGRFLAYSSSFFCGGCGSPRAQQAVRHSGMWVVDTDTGHRFQFRPGCETPVCIYESVVISPDGGSLAFVYASRYWVLDIAANRTVELAEAPRVPVAAAIVWSPDSARLALVQNDTTLSVISADGTAKTTVFDAGVDRLRDPAWSPDGQRIIFVVTGSSGGIRTIRYDGSGLSRIGPVGGLAAYPTWSPDGQSVAFLERAPDGGIWVMSSDGSHARELYPHRAGASLSAPVWAPGGGYLAFARRDGLYLISLDGTSRRLAPQLQFSGGFPWNPRTPAWQPLSASGGAE